MENPFLLWQVRIWIVFGNIITLAVFFGIGWFVDKYFGTSPKGIIASIFLSFPVSQVLLINLLKRRFLSKKS